MTEADDQAGQGEKTRVTVGALSRPLPPPKRRSKERPATASAAERRVAGLVIVALAAPALILPLPWLVAVLVLRLVAGTHRRAAVGEQRVSWALAAATSLGSGARALTTRLIPNVLRLAAAVVVAIAIPGVLAWALWLASKGTLGAYVAGRLSIYEHSIGLLSALICWCLLRADGLNGDRLAALRRSLHSMSEGGLIGTGAMSLVVTGALALLVTPATWAPWSSLAGAAGVLPSATRHAVLKLQRDAVRGEVDAVLHCLSSHATDVGWQQGSTRRNPDGSLTVRIGRRPLGPSTRGSVSALVLALQNQLPPAVSSIDVRRRSDFSPLIVTRSGIPPRRPAIDTATIATAAGVRPSALPMSNEIRRLGLTCGVATM